MMNMKPIDRATVELLDEMFPHRAPDPKDSEREVWMKAGKREIVDWLLITLQAQDEENNVLFQSLNTGS